GDQFRKNYRTSIPSVRRGVAGIKPPCCTNNTAQAHRPPVATLRWLSEMAYVVHGPAAMRRLLGLFRTREEGHRTLSRLRAAGFQVQTIESPERAAESSREATSHRQQNESTGAVSGAVVGALAGGVIGAVPGAVLG